MSNAARIRALVASCGLVTCFTLFSWRLVHLQVTMSAEYTAKAAEKHVNKEPIYAKRGSIRDVHGEMLAQNEPINTVIADGSLIEDQQALAQLLAGPLEMSEKVLLEKLAKQVESKNNKKKVPSRYIVLKKKVPELVANEIARQMTTQKLRGVHFEPDSERVYPNGQMLCHVMGYVNSENTGVEGVESIFEKYLRGYDGFRFVERDRTGRELVPYRGQEREARNGHNVQLTVDLGLQQIVEDELDAAMKQFKPKKVTCILMRPKTGEILAMANRPAFNPNEIENSSMDARRNWAITDQVEPGSTFKIVPTATALSLKLVQPDSMIFCENGAYNYCNSLLKDHHGYGELSVSDILVHSSNIGVAKLGLQIGEQRLYEAVRKFGFGERTGINLPGEVPGTVHPPHRWSKISITRVPMGQEVAATPLQVVTAMGAIANGGLLMMPQIVHSISDEQGNVVQSFKPTEVRRVATPSAVDAVRDALIQVVSKKGTAKLAHVSGYTVAGKTGTAQKAGVHGYEQGKWVVSFVGFMPAEAPEFVALVMLDEAQTGPNLNYGGLVAAPIFSRIGEKAARYMNLTPRPEEPEGNVITTQSGSYRD